MTYRILVTGSRSWTDQDIIHLTLHYLTRKHPDVVVVHGHCPRGADAIADRWARRNGVQVEQHPADWSAQGNAAGMIRNANMVKLGADICLAFIKDKSRGASHCLGLAEKAGIDVLSWRTNSAVTS